MCYFHLIRTLYLASLFSQGHDYIVSLFDKINNFVIKHCNLINYVFDIIQCFNEMVGACCVMDNSAASNPLA